MSASRLFWRMPACNFSNRSTNSGTNSQPRRRANSGTSRRTNSQPNRRASNTMVITQSQDDEEDDDQSCPVHSVEDLVGIPITIRISLHSGNSQPKFQKPYVIAGRTNQEGQIQVPGLTISSSHETLVSTLNGLFPVTHGRTRRLHDFNNGTMVYSRRKKQPRAVLTKFTTSNDSHISPVNSLEAWQQALMNVAHCDCNDVDRL